MVAVAMETGTGTNAAIVSNVINISINYSKTYKMITSIYQQSFGTLWHETG